jgi:hypothetical protein
MWVSCVPLKSALHREEATMEVENLLSLLESVKLTGRQKWMAACPAHDDGHPSLAISALDDGRILIHCFAGCGAAEVLMALDLDFSALYPDTPSSLPKVRKPWSASDVLSAVALEVLLAWHFANKMSSGETITEADRERLLLCAARLQQALEVVNG